MDEIASLLDDAVPGRTVTEVFGTGPSWNEGNETVGVTFADGETVYVKRATDGDSSRIVRERAAIDYVGANTAVPVPRVLASDASGSVPYLVTAAVDGENVLKRWTEGDGVERASLARGVGRSLARVHECRFPDHGRITGGQAGDVELDTDAWTDVLGERITEMRAMASSERFDHHFEAVRAAVAASRDLLDDAPAALVHGDPAKPNCYRTGETVGFLDWEMALVGDPAWELTRARDQIVGSVKADGPDELQAALDGGYRDVAGALPTGFEARRPVYRAVRFLGTSGFFGKCAEFVDESPEDFAEWVETEMERRLAAVR